MNTVLSLGWVVEVFWGVVGVLLWLLRSVWGVVVLVLSPLVGVVVGWLVFLGLVLLAIAVNVVSDDVHATLDRWIGDPSGDDGGDDPLAPVREAATEAFTDASGRFSPDSFERVTGLTPAEFLHLYVRSRGGRVRQGQLNSSLPWSKSTVSRLLDGLEEEGHLERVEVGRQNLVCEPHHVPDDREG